MFVIPSTKHIASRMFDFPEPFKPVIALNDSSKPDIGPVNFTSGIVLFLPEMVVRTGYDLKPDLQTVFQHGGQAEGSEDTPSRMSSSILILSTNYFGPVKGSLGKH